MKKKVVTRNIICSLTLQIVTIISGFIVPKIILLYFGSATNGLVSSINQFLNYISLLEGGVSSVIMSGLYKPLAEGDKRKISGIINATESFFRKIGLIYIVYMLCVAVIYSIFINTVYPATYVFGLTIVLGMNLFVQYFFSLSYKLLLNADQKMYFVSLTQIVIVVINMILVVATAKCFHDILIIKLFSAGIFFIQPILYHVYVKNHYNLNKSVLKDNNALKQRWNGFGQNLAFFIHTNTDVVVLTIFSSLSNVSIYSIYFMVINALKSLVISISVAIVPSLGNVLVRESREKINSVFNNYEFGMDYITSIIFTCGIVLITPFIQVYTIGITDAHYNQPVFGMLLALAEMIYCFRDPYVSVAYASGHFKQTAKYAYIEAIINIVLSIILVYHFGLIGVAIGTVISMTYRMFAHVFYLQSNILMRPCNKFFKNLFVFGSGSAFAVYLSNRFLSIQAETYGEWILLAIKASLICIIILSILSALFYKKEINAIIGKILRRI